MKKCILPMGFLANGIHCGAKKKRKDLSVFYSETPCAVSAVFTKNAVKAAPVELAIQSIKKSDRFRAIVVNSGNANCMTGKRGLSDAKKMARDAAKAIGIPESEVLISSTGIIGEYMDMAPILKGMKPLVRNMSKEGIYDAADGIMTTDRFRKISSRTLDINGSRVTVTGVAKGAGMIHPDMATMLCYIFTDAVISGGALKKALAGAVNMTFNAITVDGDMSTNDTVVLMANGMAGNRTINVTGKDFKLFRNALYDICKELSDMIIFDGEGASKFIEVTVKGAPSAKGAMKAAKAIAGSMLVKCACLGGDPNWGRVASAAGASGVKFDQYKLEIALDGVTFLKDGEKTTEVDRKSSGVFKGNKVKIAVNLHAGKYETRVNTCDISKKYIAFNSYYTT